MSESGDASTQQCGDVGEAMPDIAGIGILVAFAAQAFISLALSIWVIMLSKRGHLGVQHEEGTIEFETEKKRLEIVSEILMVGNDIQMLTGTALIITAFVGGRTLDLYHLHLIFDTVSLVAVSNCAAVICWTYTAYMVRSAGGWGRRKITKRHRATYSFAIFYLIFTILLEVRLSDWSLTGDQPGWCYLTNGLTAPAASHPTTDKIYVAVTAAGLLILIIGTLFAPTSYRKPLMLLCASQFPIHLYMMIALRVANQNALGEDESENDWDFGQTTAILLLMVTVFELFNKFLEYRHFEQQLKRDPSSMPSLLQHGESSYDGFSLLSSLAKKGMKISSASGGKFSHTDSHQQGKNGYHNPQDNGIDLGVVQMETNRTVSSA